MAWSGGKDCTLALATLKSDPSVEVVALLTTVTVDYDRVHIHGVRRELLRRQAASLGIEVYEVSLPAKATNQQYETAVSETLTQLRSQHPGPKHIAFGDLFLEDVRAYREAQLAPLGWTPLFPVWGKNTNELACQFVNDGYKAVLVCVDNTQLAAEFSGREFDAQFLDDLPASVDPCGERGEFHTFVYAGPLFKQPVNLTRGEIVLRDERFAYCELLPS